LTDLIVTTADDLRAKAKEAAEWQNMVLGGKHGRGDLDYAAIGLPNAVIVEAALDAAVALCRFEVRNTVAELLSRMVPSVLGDGLEMRALVQPMIPGLQMPSWYAVVPIDKKGPSGWKKDRDTTPNELSRIIDHRQADIDGRVVEKNKFVLLRATALELGCGEDEPLSKVFPEFEPPDDPNGLSIAA
jgi:hypothetical protein